MMTTWLDIEPKPNTENLIKPLHYPDGRKTTSTIVFSLQKSMADHLELSHNPLCYVVSECGMKLISQNL